MRVLVAYASRHGATEGIAERIARTLQRPGLEVTLRPAHQTGSVEGYDAFVIGSAAYVGHWLKEATQLLRRYRTVLASRPVWLFSSGPIGTDLVDAKGRDVLEASRPAEFTEFAQAIHPRDERIFFGAYDPSAKPIGLMERLGAPFMRMSSVRASISAGDFRDWPAIEAWAQAIARDLLPVPAVTSTPA
jgi:menaquinone-dependent protoporphyrinogen oxidase